jgi:hypothetical protein
MQPLRASLVLGLLLSGCGGPHDPPRAEDWIALSGADTPLRHFVQDQDVDDKSCVRAEGIEVRGDIVDATVAEIIAAVRETDPRDLILQVRSNGALAEVWTGKECGGPGGGHGDVLDLRREDGHWILKETAHWVH